ncbi:hypothetical protein [Polyangium mundeleinium]|uniref:CobQ/CobB/MinD/ParA nucleotide binding domain-containing protein n=1 Tax=Polyangium mundeleinium TaxID=2995306 RepID=A0ABT5F633_9BACT|nr:hypothetical protein [Polyangium mundeleinium]MDC0748863.1 hypothetical protein [Polyangium mundeleinium]
MPTVRDGYLAVFASARSDAGRAMALANLAALLAHRGDKVLVIDLAVDSPTLTRYFPDDTKRRAATSTAPRPRPAPGMVDLLAAVREEARRFPATRGPAGGGAARELVERIIEANDAAIRRVPLRYPGLPEDRTVELHFLPVGGEDTPRERNRPLDGLEAFPGVLEEVAAALRSRYDAVLLDAPTGETETTALLASHLADKLVVVLDDASLEEAIELGAWAHGRRAIASTDRPLHLFPLLVHVADGSAGRAFVEEARPRLEALLRSTLALPACDLSLYLELAQIPQRSTTKPAPRLAAEVEPTSDPQGLSHAYFRFVQCLSKTSPIKVGARARPMSAELLSAIEARRAAPHATPAEGLRAVPAERPSSPGLSSPSTIAPAAGPGGRPTERPGRPDPLSTRKLSAQHAERLAEAMALRAQGRNAEAAKICAAIVREAVRDERGSKETAKAFLALGDLSAQTETGEYDEVVRRFHERRHEDPELFESVLLALYRRGKRHAARERFALATDSLSAALELAGEWKFQGQTSSVDLRALAADAALVLGVISIERGDDARALTALGHAALSTPGGSSAAQRETEAAAACLSAFVLARSGRPDDAADRASALRERLGPSPSLIEGAIAAIAACNEGAALGLAGHYDDALAVLGALSERLAGTWQSPFHEVAAAAAYNEAAVLARAGRVEAALERLEQMRASLGGLGAVVHRVRFSAVLLEGHLLSTLGRKDAAIERLEALQDGLRWVDVCLEHPGEVYMRERRADVAWYLTRMREHARGVDELPGLLQASEEEGDARHGRVHLRAAFELVRHGRRLDDLGAHRAAGACYEEAMSRLERAGSRPPGDASMLACAGLVALSRGAAQRGIPLLRKAAEQGGTAALQGSLERMRGEGLDVEALVAAVREAFDWVPRDRTDALRAADPLGATLIRALVYPGRPPEPLLPPLPFPPVGARFAASATPVLAQGAPGLPQTAALTHVGRLLLLEPPDGTENDLATFGPHATEPVTSTRISPVSLASPLTWPERLGPHAGSAEEVATALDALYPRSSPASALIGWRTTGPDGEVVTSALVAVEVEARDGATFRLAVLNDVHGHDRLVYDGVTSIQVRDGQGPSAPRRVPTPLLALWRALAVGPQGAFSLSVAPVSSSPTTIVLTGTPREPGTGILHVELHIDRVLVARGDPAALRRVVAEDVDGVVYRFEVEATVGKIEPSLFGSIPGL